MPLDSLRDFLDQLAFAYRVWLRLVVLGSELSANLLPVARSWIFNLVYAPALTLPPTFHPLHPFSSVPSQHGCWRGTPETEDKRWDIASE